MVPLAVAQEPTEAPANGQEDAAIKVAAVSPNRVLRETPIPAGRWVPSWAADAIFYQLFPERFRNGDPTNDPTRDSLEFPENVSNAWRITPWTSDWYARSGWEKDRGDNFYEEGVFDRRYGGDLQGILDRLDYIEELGVNVLYLNPVFYARSLHKYDGNTYHHIDPNFGPDPKGDLALMEAETSDPTTWHWTAADKLFLELVREAHDRGIRIILDGVFNHTGRNFFAFENLVQTQDNSPYKDWYIVTSFDDPATADSEFAYKGWWGVATLPEFADNAAGDNLHPGPKAYIFDATRRWMDPNADGDPSDGIDGWRLDVAAEVPTGFWIEWNTLVRDLNPEAYTVAEHWEDAARFLEAGGFSATMNYHGFAWPVKGYLIDGTLSPADFGKMLTERMAAYPLSRRYAMQNLIDSHDTDRVASMIVNADAARPYLRPDRFDYDVSERATPRNWDGYSVRRPNNHERSIQRMVALMQATFVGAPMTYYGTESGMWGADDPCDRMPMVWSDKAFEPQRSDPLGRERPADKVTFDHDLHRFYTGLGYLRREFDALRRGDFEVLVADDSTGGFAFSRSGTHEVMWVAFNRGNKPWSITLQLPNASSGSGLQEVYTASGQPQKVDLSVSQGTVKLTIPPFDAVVLHLPNAALAVGR